MGATKRRPAGARRPGSRVRRRIPSGSSGFLGQLTGEEFEALMKDLLRREAHRCGLSEADFHATHQGNRGDGGVDFLVDAVPLTPSAWLRRRTIFQFKRSKPAPAKVVSELSGDAVGKLREGFSYTLVIARDLPPLQQTSLRADVKAALDKKTGASVEVSVLSDEKLKEWFRQHLALLARIPGAPPSAGLMKTWWGWRDDSHLAMEVDKLPFVDDEPRQKAMARLRQAIDRGELVRVDGPPGVGKTRLVLEATQSRADSVGYVPFGDTEASQLLAFVGPGELFGCLVLDECTAEKHEQLKALARPKELTIITIGATEMSARTRAPLDGIRLEPISDEDRHRLASSTGIGSVLPLGLREELARRTGGYPKLYRLLVDAVVSEGASFQLNVDDFHRLLNRFITRSSDAGVERALQAVALASWQTDDELIVVGRALGVPEALLRQVQDRLWERALLGRVGARMYLTPRLLGEWLALSAWRPSPVGLLRALVSAGATGELVARCLRVLLAGSQESAEVLRTLVEAHDLLEVVSIPVLSAVAESLAASDPDHAHGLIRRLLREGEGDLAALMHALRVLAWYPEHFDEAAASWAELGGEHSEIAGLFGTHLGTTRATGQQRLAVLRRWANEGERLQLAVQCAEEACSLEVARSWAGVPESLDANWHPTTEGEERSYRQAAAGILVELARQGSARRDAGMACLRVIRGLARAGFLDISLVLARGAEEGGIERHLVHRALLIIEQFDLGLLDDGERYILGEALRALGPRTVAERISALSQQTGPWDEAALSSLARELIAAPSSAAFEALFRRDAFVAFDLGVKLARADGLRVLLQPLLDASRGASNLRAIAGYLSALQGEPSAESLLDTWANDPGLTELVFTATRMLPPSLPGLRRLASLFDRGPLDRERVAELYMGAYLTHVPRAEALEFLKIGNFRPGLALLLLGQFAPPDADLEQLCLETWTGVSLEELSGFVLDTWEEIGRRLSKDQPEVVGERLSGLLDRDGNQVFALTRIVGEISPLAQQHLVETSYRRFGTQHSHRLIPVRGRLHLEDYRDWCLAFASRSEDHALFLARLIDKVFPGGLGDLLYDAHSRHQLVEATIRSRMLSAGPVWGSSDEVVWNAVQRLAKKGRPATRRLARAVSAWAKKRRDEARAERAYELEHGAPMWLGEQAASSESKQAAPDPPGSS